MVAGLLTLYIISSEVDGEGEGDVRLGAALLRLKPSSHREYNRVARIVSGLCRDCLDDDDVCQSFSRMYI